MCNEGHTVDLYELFAMRQNNRNGQPDQGVCDIRHTVHSYEPFAMIEVTQTIPRNNMCVIPGKQVGNQNCVRSL